MTEERTTLVLPAYINRSPSHNLLSYSLSLSLSVNDDLSLSRWIAAESAAMFGSTNPFGQSSSSPFGSSVFGQTASASNNPFAPKPFGGLNPFGSPTGSSMFGGMSTGAFGPPSTPTFGASSSPAFGSSTPAFGASSTSAFGGSSLFGQKPTFGGFGSTPSQSSPFASTFQQTQPSFGSNLYGSATPFGASNQPAFGSTSIPAFGATSTPAFGATSTPAFGATSTPAFGATSTPTFGATSTPAFGGGAAPGFGSSTSLFGNTGTGFGVSSTPAFGSSVTSAFGASSNPLFGASSAPSFGASSVPSFGSSAAPAFGASSTPSFGFSSSPAFGQSTSTFVSTPFGTTSSLFGAQSPPFSAQTTTPAFGSPGFGQSSFGGRQGGSRTAPYTPTPEADGSSGTTPGNLESISAMHVYKDKSHEELRWEDYQRGDKGGSNAAGQPSSGTSFAAPTQGVLFGSTSTYSQPAPNPFASPTSSNIFGSKPSTFGSTGFGSSPSIFGSSPFSSTSSSPFGSNSAAPSLFGGTSASAFGSSPTSSIFSGTTTQAFSSSPSLFGSSTVGTTTTFGSGLTFGNTQPSGLFQSSAPSFGQTPSPFGQPATGFQQTTPGFGSSLLNTPSTGFGGSLFSSSAPSILSNNNPLGFGQTTPSFSTPVQPVAQATGAFSFGNFGQQQPASSAVFGSMSNIFSQNTFAQPRAMSQPNVVLQPTPATNPFGTLPAVPRMSISCVGLSPSVQYGISSMPVAEKPVSVRLSSLISPRHVSRRISLGARKYHPKSDGPRVPFFLDDEEVPSTPKADALFIPRENPRALIIQPIEEWPLRNGVEKQSPLNTGPNVAEEHGKVSAGPSDPASNGSFADDHDGLPTASVHKTEQHNAPPTKSRPVQKSNDVQDDYVHKKTESTHHTISGNRAGEAAIVYEHGADIEALMPKLCHADYYTEPQIQELAAKERAEPGFCHHVKGFVVGRHNYGRIKFDGETDVTRVDFESIIQFNHREVIVYKDESKKPPVGQGLNKPAEVTLLNIKCVNKKTGQQYTEGPRIEKYKKMLMRKAQEQGAEFVSYDPVKGEWKFRVKHFSCYELHDGDHEV